MTELEQKIEIKNNLTVDDFWEITKILDPNIKSLIYDLYVLDEVDRPIEGRTSIVLICEQLKNELHDIMKLEKLSFDHQKEIKTSNSPPTTPTPTPAATTATFTVTPTATTATTATTTTATTITTTITTNTTTTTTKTPITDSAVLKSLRPIIQNELYCMNFDYYFIHAAFRNDLQELIEKYSLIFSKIHVLFRILFIIFLLHPAPHKLQFRKTKEKNINLWLGIENLGIVQQLIKESSKSQRILKWKKLRWKHSKNQCGLVILLKKISKENSSFQFQWSQFFDELKDKITKSEIEIQKPIQIKEKIEEGEKFLNLNDPVHSLLEGLNENEEKKTGRNKILSIVKEKNTHKSWLAHSAQERIIPYTRSSSRCSCFNVVKGKQEKEEKIIKQQWIQLSFYDPLSRARAVELKLPKSENLIPIRNNNIQQCPLYCQYCTSVCQSRFYQNEEKNLFFRCNFGCYLATLISIANLENCETLPRERETNALGRWVDAGKFGCPKCASFKCRGIFCYRCFSYSLPRFRIDGDLARKYCEKQTLQEGIRNSQPECGKTVVLWKCQSKKCQLENKQKEEKNIFSCYREQLNPIPHWRPWFCEEKKDVYLSQKKTESLQERIEKVLVPLETLKFPTRTWFEFMTDTSDNIFPKLKNYSRVLQNIKDWNNFLQKDQNQKCWAWATELQLAFIIRIENFLETQQQEFKLSPTTAILRLTNEKVYKIKIEKIILKIFDELNILVNLLRNCLVVLKWTLPNGMLFTDKNPTTKNQIWYKIGHHKAIEDFNFEAKSCSKESGISL